MGKRDTTPRMRGLRVAWHGLTLLARYNPAPAGNLPILGR